MPDVVPLHCETPRHAKRAYRAAEVVGWLFLATWAAWWVVTLINGKLYLANVTRIPAWRYLGLDFTHNYLATRFWMGGGNPYLEGFGDWRGNFAYPPIVLPLFAWCRLLPQAAAMIAWMTVISLIIAWGARAAQRARAAMTLVPIPVVLIIGLLLCSMPVVFATERGQADVIILAMILLAAGAFRRDPSWRRDLLIAACLAVAAWVKVYPAFLVLGLLALRAWRPFTLSVVLSVLIGVIPWRATKQFVSASKAAQEDRVGFLSEVGRWMFDPANHRPAQLSLYPTLSVDAHSLTTYWGSFWSYTTIEPLKRMPGVVGAAIVLMPPTLWLSLRVFRATPRARAALAYPYFLWLAAMATFIMPVSYDYNLFYLPLAALAVVDRRDPVIVPLALIALVAWAQPFVVPIPMAKDLLFFMKLFSLLGVGVSLLVRMREVDATALPDAQLDLERSGAMSSAAA